MTTLGIVVLAVLALAAIGLAVGSIVKLYRAMLRDGVFPPFG